MADLSQHTNYTAAYSGLLDNFYLTLAIAGACLIGYEVEVHIPRRRGKDGKFERVPVRLFKALLRSWSRWKTGTTAGHRGQGEETRQSSERLVRDEKKEDLARKRLGDRESWEFGYIFQPKAWAVNPCPPVPRWPLMWIVSSLKVRERDMPEKCGLDLTLHARFLRGAFFYTLMQTIVIMPILMPLHIIYSPPEIAKTSMLRASISSLVRSSGSKWLWVHALLIWWITITWTATLLWITWGGLAYRRRQVDALASRVSKAKEAKRQLSRGEDGPDRWSVAEDCEGIKRFKSLMVTNIPPDMRDETVLRDYFDHYLQRHNLRKRNLVNIASGKRKSRASFDALGKTENPDPSLSTDNAVEEVILVRKLGTIASLRERRLDVLRKLELAHVNLAKRVLAAVAKHRHATLTVTHRHHEKRADASAQIPGTKAERMERLVQVLGPFTEGIGVPRADHATVWDALLSLPRELLDPYQSLTHLTSIFRDDNAPLIDYLSTKLNYLTMLLNEARSRPLESYPASSAAFVTFKDAKTARLASKILDNHPKRSLACHTAPAPEWTDILWPRLSRSVYRSEFVRGWVVHLGVWAFTLIWIFPVSLLCALASLTNIAGFIKPLQSFLTAHPKVSSAITSLAPVILVALLTIAICPILLVIANKAETIVTRLGIHNSVLERFWKFLMVNGVVFFAIGQSAIEAYLTAFQNKSFDPLPIIASAFPTAAPYFASYILLQVAIQPCFEIFRFGLPAIVYVFGTRLSVIPRQRSSRTEHPTFSHFSQVPQQLLGGAIVHLFMLLNPLVIPFTLVYYGACYVVWKRQFTYVYGRLYETNGRRTSIRALRYSLDALALGQFVLFAFFILSKAKGHAISTGILFFLTLISKLIITRALKRRFRHLDAQEADILCPPVSNADEDPSDAASETSEVNDPDEWATPEEKPDSRYKTVKKNFSRWAGSWKHSTRTGGTRKPIPFDHVLFATLDSKISFDQPQPDPQSQSGNGDGDVSCLEHDAHRKSPDHIPAVVAPHPPLPPWEDIPPYQRARGYRDQPAYTDEFDDFLWLPRDPLSTLDLDDTVKMRLALTTSAGGAGKISDWPQEDDVLADSAGEEEAQDQEHEHEQAQLQLDQSMRRESEDMYAASPGGGSERRLVSTPSIIGSEADTHSRSHLVRRHTHKVVGNLTHLFGRPRATTMTTQSDADAGGDGGMGIAMLPMSERTGSATDDVFGRISPTIRLVTTPSRLSTGGEHEHERDPMAEVTAEPRSGSHISFAASLGRSPSGRRPTPLRTGSSDITEELRSPRSGSASGSGFGVGLGRNRSLGHRSPQRSLSRSRSRNASAGGSGMSSDQRRMLTEVIMEEERLASKDAKDAEKEERAREEEEVLKEQERSRKASASEAQAQAQAQGAGAGAGGLMRRFTRQDSNASRPNFDRSRGSNRSRASTIQVQVQLARPIDRDGDGDREEIRSG